MSRTVITRTPPAELHAHFLVRLQRDTEQPYRAYPVTIAQISAFLGLIAPRAITGDAYSDLLLVCAEYSKAFANEWGVPWGSMLDLPDFETEVLRALYGTKNEAPRTKNALRPISPKAAREALASRTCPCGDKKRRGQPFCHHDFRLLPNRMRDALGSLIGHGFEEAYAAALEYLGCQTPALKESANRLTI